MVKLIAVIILSIGIYFGVVKVSFDSTPITAPIKNKYEQNKDRAADRVTEVKDSAKAKASEVL